MKVWKLVSGILSIIFFCIVTLQSCTVGVANALSEHGENTGTLGFGLAFFMLIGAIISIVVHKSEKNGGNIALIVIFGLATLSGLAGSGSNYGDLIIWTIWCAVNVLLAIISIFINKKKSKAAVPYTDTKVVYPEDEGTAKPAEDEKQQ